MRKCRQQLVAERARVPAGMGGAAENRLRSYLLVESEASILRASPKPRPIISALLSLVGTRRVVGRVPRPSRARSLHRYAQLTQCWPMFKRPTLRSAKAWCRPPGRSALMPRALAGPSLAGLWRFRQCAQVSCGVRHLLLFRLCAQLSSGPQHLLLIGFPILRKQFHLSPEPVLICLEYIGRRLGIAHMLGRFKRRLRALMTTGKPSVRKFLQAFKRCFLVLPKLDAHRRKGLQRSCWLQDVRK